MTDRVYQGGGIKLRIGGLDGPGSVRIHIEHESGAALIVPGADQNDGESLRVVGFDGTLFEVIPDDTEARIRASQPTQILGGDTEAVVPRGPDPEPGAVRVTGDEQTMPISVKS